MSADIPTQHDERARIVLRGERVADGAGLAVLGRVIAGLTDALRGHARATRGQPGRRQGTPSAFDEAATDLRLAGIERGSAILVLEAPPLEEPLGVEHLAAATFDGLLQDLEREAVPSDVIDAFERALAPLGADAEIALDLRGRRQAVDRTRLDALRRAPGTEPPRRRRVIGRLRALDLDRNRIGIRSAGVEWDCSYPEEMAPRVIEAINRMVVATGLASAVAPSRGRITLEELEVVPEAVQGALFEWAPRSLEELRAAQGDPGQGGSIIPAGASDEEAERFLAALEGL